MKFEQFEKELLDILKEKTGQSFPDCRLVITPIVKINRKLTGISLENGPANSVLYLEEIYDYYCDGEKEIEKVADMVFELLIRKNERFSNDAALKILNDMDYIRSHLQVQLINSAENHELLKNIPYIKFMDIAVICKLILFESDKEIADMIVNHSILNYLKLDKDTLFQYAFENLTKKPVMYLKNNPNAQTIDEFIIRSHSIDSVPRYSDEYWEAYDPDSMIDINQFMCILTTGKYGANIMLNRDVFEKLADHMSSDLYILPSSNEEVIILPTKAQSYKRLKSVVKEINHAVLEQSLYLSDNIYIYERANKNIRIVD